LEDDTIVGWGFLAKLVAADLGARRHGVPPLVRQVACPFRTVVRNAIERQRSVIELFGRPYGTQGYLLTHRVGTAEEALAWADTAG
jgi:hypothetical protein